MNYNDCKAILDATKHIFKGTDYGLDYDLSATTFFTKHGEFIEDSEFPEHLRVQFDAIIETLEIDY